MSTPGYFELRKMDPEHTDQVPLPPAWLKLVLSDPGERVLEIGCGLGAVLNFLKEKGYQNLVGVDVDQAAVTKCLEDGLEALLISDLLEYLASGDEPFDLVLMLHVLEHLEKKEIIPVLKAIRERMSHGGRIVVSVPNAQSSTGSYWAYEDFTHSTIFTAGSLYHVLAASGFSQVQLIDPLGLAGLGLVKALLRRPLVALYGWARTVINKVTGSSWHAPSPDVYTFEVKAVAYKR
jgi:cyclopropane fatty-acyl-phospholipid synthase-like methyltransferase